MLYFGSRNFGQANFGKGLITTAVDEFETQSTMQVAGYNFFNTCAIDPEAQANTDIAAGILRIGHLGITPETTVVASKILMTWSAWYHINLQPPVEIAGKIAWDTQTIDDATWTEQIIE
tara:strand:+ start:270 stop:626 length:357 start_codon:yes stop_codon:yes gene_type:complete